MTHRNLIAERINEDFDTFDKDEWILTGDAKFRTNRVRLTPSLSDKEGTLIWREDFTKDIWDLRFQFDIENGSSDPADEVMFSWYNNGVNGSGYKPIGGYQVSYDHFDDEIRLDSYIDGEQKTLASSNVSIADSGTVSHFARIQYTRGTVTVSMDGDRYINYDIRDPVVSGPEMFFSSRTSTETASHFVDDIRLSAGTERNIKTVQKEWPSPAVEIGNNSNTYKLLNALVSVLDEEDKNLNEVKRAHHIDTASDEELEEFGDLVQLQRKSGESDEKYRARLKVQYRVGNIGTTFDQFSQFTATLLSTDIDNVEFVSDLESDPATAVVAADPSVYTQIDITKQETIDFLSEAVPAGHEVKVLERGTFRLKEDGDVDNPDKGLTSDSISTGGTLAADLV